MKFTAFFLLFAMLMMSLFNIDMVDARPVPVPVPVPAPVPIPKAYAKARPFIFAALPHIARAAANSGQPTPMIGRIAGAIAAVRAAMVRKP
ncbi:hypothetical protein GQ42DRAFT_160619 [Ramicandelaber brevisporus]|nr:hypothetical protein GQ42DRAFT_160619 [Ramicandelaber brevisporus]